MTGPLALPAIAPLAEADPEAIERLLDAAFGAGRRTRTAYRIRQGMAPLPALSFAAHDEADGSLIGALQSWPIALRGGDGRGTPLILVGPVAVTPARQREGLGRLLMERMLRDADAGAAAADPLVLIGDPEYYGRFFGFSADATGGWEAPGPVERHRLLARAGGRPLPPTGMLGPR